MWSWLCFSSSSGLGFQDVFHMGTHWMQAGGIFRKILDPFMNAQPDLPLKRLRGADEALKPEQLTMLFIVWGFGMSCALLSFVGELGDEVQNMSTLRGFTRGNHPIRPTDIRASQINGQFICVPN